MKNYEYKVININELYVNPENYRYINDVEDEENAIISMFNVTTGMPTKEMINLSKDIVTDGLNPFEMPIVCYDDDIKKYIVYDGNRRITCIKLMTQYKNNKNISEKVSGVNEIYNLNCDISEVQCVLFDNSDDAKYYLYKIHQDINDGIGRKQWDYQAKMKAEAHKGNKSRTYAIVEYVKTNSNASRELINDMNTHRWISKLERVVGFAKFREAYNITFDATNSLLYKDSDEQLLLMMSKLISDLIHNSATNNFRFKDDFDRYISNLDGKYKSQILTTDTNFRERKEEFSSPFNNNEGNEINNKTLENFPLNNEKHEAEEISNTAVLPATGEPKTISRKTLTERAALQLGKRYNDDNYNCLNEKGKQMLVELQALNIKEYPFAAAALCRALLENILKLWIDSEGGTQFNSNSLPSTYNGCLNVLSSKKIVDSKEHSVLKALVNKEDYISLLNTWIHSDTSACVSETSLVSGWKNTRLLIEKYIDTHKE